MTNMVEDEGKNNRKSSATEAIPLHQYRAYHQDRRVVVVGAPTGHAAISKLGKDGTGGSFIWSVSNEARVKKAAFRVAWEKARAEFGYQRVLDKLGRKYGLLSA
jgi:hypothetical protein